MEKNNFIGIKRKSGSGKTTLLSILGLLEDFEGNYVIDDIKITKENKEEIRKEYFSYVFQKPYLIPYLTVKENIIMPLKNAHEKIDESLLNDLIKTFQVEDLMRRKVTNLSGGEAQRISLIRAVMSKRPIILCDEPTGSLDPENAKKVMDCLLTIKNKYNKTIIMVTHSVDFDSYFDKLVKIEGNKINYDL